MGGCQTNKDREGCGAAEGGRRWPMERGPPAGKALREQIPTGRGTAAQEVDRRWLLGFHARRCVAQGRNSPQENPYLQGYPSLAMQTAAAFPFPPVDEIPLWVYSTREARFTGLFFFSFLMIWIEQGPLVSESKSHLPDTILLVSWDPYRSHFTRNLCQGDNDLMLVLERLCPWT